MQLLYLSKATKAMSRQDLTKLQIEAYKFNKTQKITGALLYSKGTFIQVLEGDSVKVVDLYERIKLDQRHESVQRLFFSEIRQRIFGDWSMALYVLDGKQDLDLTPIETIIDFAEFAGSKNVSSGAVTVAALREFIRQMDGDGSMGGMELRSVA